MPNCIQPTNNFRYRIEGIEGVIDLYDFPNYRWRTLCGFCTGIVLLGVFKNLLRPVSAISQAKHITSLRSHHLVQFRRERNILFRGRMDSGHDPSPNVGSGFPYALILHHSSVTAHRRSRITDYLCSVARETYPYVADTARELKCVVLRALLANIETVARRLTVMYYFRVLELRWLDVPLGKEWSIDLDSAPSNLDSVLTLLGAIAVFMLVGALMMMRREFRMKTPEGS